MQRRSFQLRTVAPAVAVTVAVVLSVACSSVQLHPIRSTADDPGGYQSTRVRAKGRVVAIGDLHGDYLGLRRVLRMTRITDKADNWVAGDTTLVQVGDVLDRGDGERQIFDLLDKLRTQAAKAGGQVITLLGNHEVMNALGDFRYVTAGGFVDFDATPGLNLSAAKAEDRALDEARRKAFEPGGPWARRLARFGVVVIVDDTLYVHAGILPQHARYGLSRINREVRMWMLGDARFPWYIGRDNSPVWTRIYADKDKSMCTVLESALKLSGAKRMVVAHTVQHGGPTQACEGQLWRIDVGISRAYGGRAAAIDIIDGKVRVIDKFLTDDQLNPKASPQSQKAVDSSEKTQ